MHHRATGPSPRAWFGALPVLLVALCTGVAMPGARAGEFYADALERYQTRDYRGALIQLKNELQQQPDSLAARVLLGRVYLALGDPLSARQELRRARQRGADPALVIPLIASTYFAERNYAGFLGDYPEPRPSEDAAATHAARAEALLRLNRPEEAEQAIANAVRSQPHNVSWQLARAQVLVRLGRADEAEQVANTALEVAPENAEAWYLKGELSRRRDDLEGASRHYEKALDLDPYHLGARVGLAVSAMQLGRLDEASELRAGLDEKFGDHPQTLLLDAQLQRARGDLEGWSTSLQRAAVEFDAISPEVVETDTFLLWLGGNIHYHLASWEKAQQHLSRYVRLMPFEVEARAMLAEVQVQTGAWQQALDVLRTLPDSMRRTPRIQSTLGYAYLRAGRPDEAVEVLRGAADALPDVAALRMAVGMAERAAGHPDAAREALRQALAMDASLLEAAWELVQLEVEAGQQDSALALARDILERHPGSARAHTLMADALVASGDGKAAVRSLRHALRLDPGFLDAKRRLGQALASQGDVAAAAVEYESILAAVPSDVDALSQLAALAERRGDLPAAVAWLERLREHAGIRDPRMPRLVELYLELERGEAALELATALDRDRPVSPPRMMLLGRALIHQGELERARRLLSAPYGLLLNSPRELFELATLQLSAGSLDDARRSLDTVLEQEPDSLAAHAAYVTLDIRVGRMDEALARAERMRQAHPDSAMGHVLLARVHVAAGRFEQAAASYEAALAREPSWTLAQRLFQARVSAGRMDEAQSGLATWVEANPAEPAPRRLLATSYLQSGDLPAARREHEALLARWPGNAEVLNNLAWIAWKLGDEDAVRHAREAYRLAPESHAVLDTLGWVLVEQGQLSEGLGYLREAHVRAADAPGIRYHLAAALARLGQVAEARQHLNYALRNGGAFRERAEADDLLRSLDTKSPAS